MNWHFNNNAPIYNQLVEKIEHMIITGEYAIGEKILSVREFAILAKVSPNTMQRALDELEGSGLIYTKRTSGKYVTDDEEFLKKKKNDIIDKKIKDFLQDIKEYELSTTDIIKKIKEMK